MTILAALALSLAPVFAPLQEGAPTLPPDVAAYVSTVRKAADRLSKGDLDAAYVALDGAELAQRGFEWNHLALGVLLAREAAARPLVRDDPTRGARGGRGDDPLASDAGLATFEEPVVRATSALRGHTSDPRTVAFSQDGNRIAVPGIENDVRIWNARTGDVERTLTGHAAPVTGLAFAPDGRRLASSSRDGTLRSWECYDGAPALVMHATGAAIELLAWSSDGAQLASADATFVVRLWTGDRSEARLALRGHEAAVTALAFSPDGRRLASCSKDGSVRVWDVESGEALLRFVPGPGQKPTNASAAPPSVTACAFEPGTPANPAGTLLTGTSDGYLRRHAVLDGSELVKLRTYGGELRAVAVTADGRRFATGSENGRVQIWHPAGVPLYTAHLADVEVRALAFDARGTRLVAVTGDRTVHVLETDAATARVVQRTSAEALPSAEAAAAMKPLAVDASCRRVVYRPGLLLARYEEAEALLIAAAERMPDGGPIPTTLGAARYRQERYEEALVTLSEAGEKRRGQPANLAFRAMTLARLARLDEARAQLERLETLMREERWKNDVEAGVLRDEARTVVRAALEPKR